MRDIHVRPVRAGHSLRPDRSVLYWRLLALAVVLLALLLLGSLVFAIASALHLVGGA